MADIKVNSGLLEFSEDQKVFVSVEEDDTVTKAVLIDREGNETALGALPTNEQVQEAVNAWLDDHPEATTTVEDGAITTAKLADGSVTDDKLAADGIKAEVAALSLLKSGVAISVNCERTTDGVLCFPTIIPPENVTVIIPAQYDTVILNDGKYSNMIWLVMYIPDRYKGKAKLENITMEGSDIVELTKETEGASVSLAAAQPVANHTLYRVGITLTGRVEVGEYRMIRFLLTEYEDDNKQEIAHEYYSCQINMKLTETGADVSKTFIPSYPKCLTDAFYILGSYKGIVYDKADEKTDKHYQLVSDITGNAASPVMVHGLSCLISSEEFGSDGRPVIPVINLNDTYIYGAAYHVPAPNDISEEVTP